MYAIDCICTSFGLYLSRYFRFFIIIQLAIRSEMNKNWNWTIDQDICTSEKGTALRAVERNHNKTYTRTHFYGCNLSRGRKKTRKQEKTPLQNDIEFIVQATEWEKSNQRTAKRQKVIRIVVTCASEHQSVSLAFHFIIYFFVVVLYSLPLSVSLFLLWHQSNECIELWLNKKRERQQNTLKSNFRNGFCAEIIIEWRTLRTEKRDNRRGKIPNRKRQRKRPSTDKTTGAKCVRA